MYPPTLSYITLLYGGVEKKKQREKKGASFSPHQLGEAMLCPCNCVGISSINSATLDNKYRVHRQLLWDLKRGCVKVCVCVCLCVYLCLSLCVYWKGKKLEQVPLPWWTTFLCSYMNLKKLSHAHIKCYMMVCTSWWSLVKTSTLLCHTVLYHSFLFINAPGTHHLTHNDSGTQTVQMFPTLSVSDIKY